MKEKGGERMDDGEGNTEQMRIWRCNLASCSVEGGSQKRQNLSWVGPRGLWLPESLSPSFYKHSPIQCSISSKGSRMFQSTTRKGFLFSCSLGMIRGTDEREQQNPGDLIKLKLRESKTWWKF